MGMDVVGFAFGSTHPTDVRLGGKKKGLLAEPLYRQGGGLGGLDLPAAI